MNTAFPHSRAAFASQLADMSGLPFVAGAYEETRAELTDHFTGAEETYLMVSVDTYGTGTVEVSAVILSAWESGGRAFHSSPLDNMADVAAKVIEYRTKMLADRSNGIGRGARRYAGL